MKFDQRPNNNKITRYFWAQQKTRKDCMITLKIGKEKRKT